MRQEQPQRSASGEAEVFDGGSLQAAKRLRLEACSSVCVGITPSASILENKLKIAIAAAVCVQRHWRGFSSRRGKAELTRQVILIQRAIRKWQTAHSCFSQNKFERNRKAQGPPSSALSLAAPSAACSISFSRRMQQQPVCLPLPLVLQQESRARDENAIAEICSRETVPAQTPQWKPAAAAAVTAARHAAAEARAAAAGLSRDTFGEKRAPPSLIPKVPSCSLKMITKRNEYFLTPSEEAALNISYKGGPLRSYQNGGPPATAPVSRLLLSSPLHTATEAAAPMARGSGSAGISACDSSPQSISVSPLLPPPTAVSTCASYAARDEGRVSGCSVVYKSLIPQPRLRVREAPTKFGLRSMPPQLGYNNPSGGPHEGNLPSSSSSIPSPSQFIAYRKRRANASP